MCTCGFLFRCCVKGSERREQTATLHTPSHQTAGDPTLSIEGFINHGIEIQESQDPRSHGERSHDQQSLDQRSHDERSHDERSHDQPYLLSHDVGQASKRSSLAWSENGGSQLGLEDGTTSNIDLSAILGGPGDSSSGVWDVESIHTEHSETGSLGMPRGARSRTGSTKSGTGAGKDVQYEGKTVRAMKKRKRNRHVDIDDIVIEFDPQKEYMWEMRLKYEREKRKKVKSQKTTNNVADNKATKQNSSMESLSADRGPDGDGSTVMGQVSQESKLWNAVERSSPNPEVDSPIPPKRKSSKRQSNRSSTPEATPVPNSEKVDEPSEGYLPGASQGHTQVPEGTINLSQSDHTHGAINSQQPLTPHPNTIIQTHNSDNAPRSPESTETFPQTVDSAGGVEVEDTSPDTTMDSSSKDESVVVEVLVIHRLPGEKLGMGLSIESQGNDNDPVEGVFVQNITPGGAADKATGGKHGICVGDEILEINGTPMKAVSYSETLAFFRALPLRMILCVKRVFTPPGVDVIDEVSLPQTSYDHPIPTSQPGELEIPENFQLVEVSFDKKLEENLGLSIMPSYGSTHQYYQVKRVSPSGVSSREGRLSQGDRLISYNNTPMTDLSHDQVQSLLRQLTRTCHFTVLRTVSEPRPPGSRAVFGYQQPAAPQTMDGPVADNDADMTDPENVLGVIEVDDASVPDLNQNQLFAQYQVRLPYAKTSTTSSDNVDHGGATSEESGPESKRMGSNEITGLSDITGLPNVLQNGDVVRDRSAQPSGGGQVHAVEVHHGSGSALYPSSRDEPSLLSQIPHLQGININYNTDASSSHDLSHDLPPLPSTLPPLPSTLPPPIPSPTNHSPASATNQVFHTDTEVSPASAEVTLLTVSGRAGSYSLDNLPVTNIDDLLDTDTSMSDYTLSDADSGLPPKVVSSRQHLPDVLDTASPELPQLIKYTRRSSLTDDYESTHDIRNASQSSDISRPPTEPSSQSIWGFNSPPVMEPLSQPITDHSDIPEFVNPFEQLEREFDAIDSSRGSSQYDLVYPATHMSTPYGAHPGQTFTDPPEGETDPLLVSIMPEVASDRAAMDKNSYDLPPTLPECEPPPLPSGPPPMAEEDLWMSIVEPPPPLDYSSFNEMYPGNDTFMDYETLKDNTKDIAMPGAPVEDMEHFAKGDTDVMDMKVHAVAMETNVQPVAMEMKVQPDFMETNVQPVAMEAKVQPVVSPRGVKSLARMFSDESPSSAGTPTSPKSPCTPSTSTSVDRPRTPTSADRPRTPTSVDRPRTPTSADRPRTPTSVDRPRTPTSVDHPRTLTSADRPRTPIPVDRPRTPTSVDRPRTPTSVDRPRTPTSADRPRTPTSADRPRTPIPVDRPKTPTSVDRSRTPTSVDHPSSISDNTAALYSSPSNALPITPEAPSRWKSHSGSGPTSPRSHDPLQGDPDHIHSHEFSGRGRDLIPRGRNLGSRGRDPSPGRGELQAMHDELLQKVKVKDQAWTAAGPLRPPRRKSSPTKDGSMQNMFERGLSNMSNYEGSLVNSNNQPPSPPTPKPMNAPLRSWGNTQNNTSQKPTSPTSPINKEEQNTTSPVPSPRYTKQTSLNISQQITPAKSQQHTSTDYLPTSRSRSTMSPLRPNVMLSSPRPYSKPSASPITSPDGTPEKSLHTTSYMMSSRARSTPDLTSASDHQGDPGNLEDVSRVAMTQANLSSSQIYGSQLFRSSSPSRGWSPSRAGGVAMVTKHRTDDRPFQVEVLKGMLGLGLQTDVHEDGVVIREVEEGGPVGRNGNIRPGDYLIAINGRELRSLTQDQVNHSLKLLPSSLIRLLVSTHPPGDSIHDNHHVADTVSVVTHDSNGPVIDAEIPYQKVADSQSDEEILRVETSPTGQVTVELIPATQPDHTTSDSVKQTSLESSVKQQDGDETLPKQPETVQQLKLRATKTSEALEKKLTPESTDDTSGDGTSLTVDTESSLVDEISAILSDYNLSPTTDTSGVDFSTSVLDATESGLISGRGDLCLDKEEQSASSEDKKGVSGGVVDAANTDTTSDPEEISYKSPRLHRFTDTFKPSVTSPIVKESDTTHVYSVAGEQYSSVVQPLTSKSGNQLVSDLGSDSVDLEDSLPALPPDSPPPLEPLEPPELSEIDPRYYPETKRSEKHLFSEFDSPVITGAPVSGPAVSAEAGEQSGPSVPDSLPPQIPDSLPPFIEREDLVADSLPPLIEIQDTTDPKLPREPWTPIHAPVDTIHADGELSEQLVQLDMEYYRPRSASLRGTPDGSNPSSRRSSFSESGSTDGSRRAPPLSTGGRMSSVVDAMDQKRRESLGTTRLRGLQLPSRQNSAPATTNPALPVIAGMAKAPMLPTLKVGERRPSYQPLLPQPFKPYSSTSSESGGLRRFSSTLPMKASSSMINLYADDNKENLTNGTADRSNDRLCVDDDSKSRSSSFGSQNSDDVFRSQSPSTVSAPRSQLSKAYSATPFSRSHTFTSATTRVDSNHDAINKDAPLIPKTSPPTQQTAPMIPQTAPMIPQTAPMIPQTAPMVPQTAPLIQTATLLPDTDVPLIPQSVPLVPQSVALVPQSEPIVPQTVPLIPQSAPLIPQSAPLIPQTAPLIPPTAPISQSYHTVVMTAAIPTSTSLSQSNIPATSSSDIESNLSVSHSYLSLAPRDVEHKSSSESSNVSSDSTGITVIENYNVQRHDNVPAYSPSARVTSQLTIVTSSTIKPETKSPAPQSPPSLQPKSYNPPTHSKPTTATYPRPIKSSIYATPPSVKSISSRFEEQVQMNNGSDRIPVTSVSKLNKTLHQTVFQENNSSLEKDISSVSPSLVTRSTVTPNTKTEPVPDLPVSSAPTTGDLLGLGDDVVPPIPELPVAPPPGALNASGSFDSLLDLPNKSDGNIHIDSADELDNISRNCSPRRPGSKTSFGHSREDLSEGHGSFLDSPVAPLSPTPSDADSGIYSTKTDHRSDLESLASKDTSPSGTWKSDRFPSVLKSEKVIKSASIDSENGSPSKSMDSHKVAAPDTHKVAADDGHQVTARSSQQAVALDSHQMAANQAVSADSPQVAAPDDTILVELEKGNIGIGFCIEGGKNSPLGDQPIKVKRLFKGDTPAQRVLKPGDEIIKVNDTDVSVMSKFSAWNHLKSLPLGTVKLLLRRK